MRIPRDFLTFRDVSTALLISDLALTGGRNQAIIRESLTWREIALPTISERATPFSGRDIADPGSGRAARPSRHLRDLPYRERWQLAMRGEYP
jgi:hypothetical protein